MHEMIQKNKVMLKWENMLYNFFFENSVWFVSNNEDIFNTRRAFYILHVLFTIAIWR